MSFWDNFNKINNKSLKHIANLCNYDYHSFCNLRTAGRTPKAEDVVIIANELNCSTDFLLTGKEFHLAKHNNPKYVHLMETLEKKLILWNEQDLDSFQNIINKML